MKRIINYQNRNIRNAILSKRMQIFEVMQVAELEEKFKKQCRLSLNSYRQWQINYQNEKDGVERLYGQLNGIVLRRQAINSIQAYWFIRQDFRIIFKKYMEALAPYKTLIAA